MRPLNRIVSAMGQVLTGRPDEALSPPPLEDEVHGNQGRDRDYGDFAGALGEGKAPADLFVKNHSDAEVDRRPQRRPERAV